MTKREIKFDEFVQLFVEGEVEELTNEQVLEIVRNPKQIAELARSERAVIIAKVYGRLSDDPELLEAVFEEIKKREK